MLHYCKKAKQKGVMDRLLDIAKHKGLIVAILLICIIFSYNVKRAIEFNMHRDQPFWVVDAIPPVISKIFFGHNKNYTSLSEIHNNFYNKVNTIGSQNGNLDIIIQDMIKSPIQNTKNYNLLGNDDKGIVDFVSIAFKFFGAKSASVLYLYYVILALSSILFLIEFRDSLPHLFLLACTLTLLYLIMPSIKYNGQLTSIFALRVFPLLSIVACLHCISYLLRPICFRQFSQRLAIFAVQIAIIFFITHMRSPTIWQIGILLCTAMFLLSLQIYRFYKNKEVSNELLFSARISQLITVLVIISVGYGFMSAYRFVSFPREYRNGGQILTRVFWHNIYSGFAYNPFFADKYQLRIDDLSIMAATSEYLKEQNRFDDLKKIGNFEAYQVRWDLYDLASRDMLFCRCLQYPLECISTFFYHKPIALYKNIFWLYGFRKYPPNPDIFVSRVFGDIVKQQFTEASNLMDARGHRMDLFKLTALLIIIPFTMLILFQQQHVNNLKIVFYSALILFFGSLATTIIGYPGAHTISESAVSFGIIIYFVLLILVYSLMYICKNALKTRELSLVR